MKKIFIWIVVVICVSVLVYSLPGGQGKAQGNSCMAQCMGLNADSYDTSKELTQSCKNECGLGIGAGACLTSEDDCCVPNTGDLDCDFDCGTMISFWDGSVSGSNANDIVGTNEGDLLNGASSVAGFAGPSFLFDGVNDYIDIPNPSVPLGNAPRTISLWFQTSANVPMSFFNYGSSSQYKAFYINQDATTDCLPEGGSNPLGTVLAGTYGSPTNVCGFVATSDGQWHHGVATFDGTTLSVYIDGALRNSGPRVETNTQFNLGWKSGMNIGRSFVEFQYVHGMIDEIMLFNNALTAGQVKQIYNAGSAGICI